MPYCGLMLSSINMDCCTIALVVIIISTLWLYTSWISNSFQTLTSKRILLLTAHPDDEAMFFAPTLQTLARPELGNQVKILCLSTGNANGIGETRKRELRRSANLLGLGKKEDVIILDDPNFQDGPKSWDHQILSRFLISAFVPDLSHTPKDKALTTLVDVIITFDERGISQHPNHISCFHGVEEFLSALTRGRNGWACPIVAYSLTSISLARKYLGVLDCVFTVLAAIFKLGLIGLLRRRRHDQGISSILRRSRIEYETQLEILVFVNSPSKWGTALRSMISGHWSQMVWFRWGWIGFGRYMVINDLKRIKVVSSDVKSR